MNTETKIYSRMLSLLNLMENKDYRPKELHDLMRSGGYISYSQLYTLIRKLLKHELIIRITVISRNGIYRLSEKGKRLSKFNNVFKFIEELQ